MSLVYTHQLLRVVVAQICQTIGWHSIQSTPLELMIDILDQYLREITCITYRYAELYNRTDPSLDDVALSYGDMGINLSELQEYLEFVDPIEKPCEAARYPMRKETHLNFLKPGSKEVLTRPVHIPEYMPPVLLDPEAEEREKVDGDRKLRQPVDDTVEKSISNIKIESIEISEIQMVDDDGTTATAVTEVEIPMETVMEPTDTPDITVIERAKRFGFDDHGAGDTGQTASRLKTEEGRPTREISSVIMTTSGFISPAREGKLPDSKIPIVIEERSRPLPPPAQPPMSTPLPVSKIDEKFGRRTKKKPIDKEKEKEKKKERKVIKTEKASKSEEIVIQNTASGAITAPSSVVESEGKDHNIATGQMVTDELKMTDFTAERPYYAARAPSPDVAVVQANPATTVLQTVPQTIPVAPPKQKPIKLKQPKEKATKKKKGTVVDSSAAGAIVPELPHKQKLKRPKLYKKMMGAQYFDPMTFQPQTISSNTVPTSAPSLVHPPYKTSFLNLLNASRIASSANANTGLTNLLSKQTASSTPFATPGHLAAANQLTMLQKLHPSLEITTAPPLPPAADKLKLNTLKKTAKSKEPLPVDQVIVIDDDMSPPHQPQSFMPAVPPFYGNISKKQRNGNKVVGTGFDQTSTQIQDQHAFGMNVSNPDYPSSLDVAAVAQKFSSFREFSPPKTPSNIPKTPDIKLQSSSSSSTSWISETGKIATSTSTPSSNILQTNLFDQSGTLGTTPSPGFLGQKFASEFTVQQQQQKKVKKPKPKISKEPKRSKAMAAAVAAAAATAAANSFSGFQQVAPPVSKEAISGYTLFNKSLQTSAVRNPIFSMLPLASGPGLIPENPLFPALNTVFPGQGPTPFHMAPNPFGMGSLSNFNDYRNLLRLSRPPKPAPLISGSGELFDECLDPETKLARTPLDLQKSTCNVAPLVPPSLQIIKSESLNLSTKQLPTATSITPIKEIKPQPSATSVASLLSHPTPLAIATKSPATAASMSTTNYFSSSSSSFSGHNSGGLTLEKYRKEEKAVILPAASVLPGAVLTPLIKETSVIDVDDSDGSQSTSATMSQKNKDGKRKSKEHKKDRKLKDGKIKKKKDKKDKNKNKDRDRDRQGDSGIILGCTAGGPMTIGMLPAEDVTMEQLRREKKEKKEKRKEKLKKERRREKERLVAAAAAISTGLESALPANFPGDNTSDTSSASVPKLMLKLSGSNATPSPRSETPPFGTVISTTEEFGEESVCKRDGSPELARISALVTRPPKMKTPSSGGSSSGGGGKYKKDDDRVVKASSEHIKSATKLDFSEPSLTGIKPVAGGSSSIPTMPTVTAGLPTASVVGGRPRIQPLPDSIDPFAVALSSTHGNTSTLKSSGSAAELTKKPSKETKSSKSSSSSLLAMPVSLHTPINMTDAEGNVVWICPACGRVDDGTPMIGCDGCDAWYHWVCVGIQVPPDSNEDWYCRVCIGKKQETHGDEKQKKRKKKDKKNPKH